MGKSSQRQNHNKQMHPQRERIKELIKAISEEIYERDEAISLALLSSIAGESIFLLGLPGVGKSLIGRRLKLAFKDASSFEYLMSRFSTPDEIFGPVSISKLKDEDTYERIIEGYLPAADIVFLDEIWKAGPSIQNALLTVLNEKIYRNGRNELRLPLKGIIAASNELPAENEGLEALWDRFLVRLIVSEIQDKQAFNEMITSTTHLQIDVDETLQISNTQYTEWQEAINTIEVPKVVLEIISNIREEIAKLNIQQQEKANHPLIIVSDRRWKKIIRLLRTCALLNGRSNIEISDMPIITHCLWTEQEQIQHIDAITYNAITNHLLSKWVLRLNEIENQINKFREAIKKNKDNDGFVVYEQNQLNIIGVNKGRTFISQELYDSLYERIPREVILTITDNSGENFQILPPPKNNKTSRIVIAKTSTGVKINGKGFRIERKSDLNQSQDTHLQELIRTEYENATELHQDFKAFIENTQNQFAENLFVFNFSIVTIGLERFEITLRKALRGFKQ